MGITHTFVSGIADDATAAAAGEVLPSHWNAAHTISLTTADVTASANKNYVTDAQAVVIGNTSGTNSGNETAGTIKTALGITTLSGSNTGDQTSVSGNAGTATALASARTIGGVSFDGTANITQPYDMIVSAAGVPTASQVLLKITMPRAVTLAANLSGSKPTAADVAATASTVVEVKKNGSQVATLTYAISGTVPTLATSGGAAVNFAADDILTVVCPASPDATLSGIYIVLAGTR